MSDIEAIRDEDQKAAGERRPMCDHICLKDDGHVERGEPHFYGYELPSPRADRVALENVEALLRVVEGNYYDAANYAGLMEAERDEARAEAERVPRWLRRWFK